LEEFRRLQIEEMKRKAAAAEEQRRLRGILFQEMGIDPQAPSTSTVSGVLSQAPRGVLADPSRLDTLGTYMALSGEPGAATLINVADRLRQREQERKAAESFKSRPGVLGAGVASNTPQGQALLGNLTGDQDFDAAILQAQNE